jgi:hypothetical protein
MGAIRIDCHVLQRGTRWITAGRDHLPSYVIGQFDGDPHGIRIPFK